MKLPEFLPYTFRCYCNYLSNTVEEKFKTDNTDAALEVRQLAVGGFIFLRLICPALINPEAANLTVPGELNNDSRRFLVIITKILQNLANGTIVANKEGFMDYFTIMIKKKHC